MPKSPLPGQRSDGIAAKDLRVEERMRNRLRKPTKLLLEILCIVNIYQTHIILETTDWGYRHRLTKTLTLISDGACWRDRHDSHPVDANQLNYILQLIFIVLLMPCCLMVNDIYVVSIVLD